MKEAKEILEQLLADLLNTRERVSNHMTNALFEIDRAIKAIQNSIGEMDDEEKA